MQQKKYGMPTKEIRQQLAKKLDQKDMEYVEKNCKGEGTFELPSGTFLQIETILEKIPNPKMRVILNTFNIYLCISPPSLSEEFSPKKNSTADLPCK